MSKFKLIKNNNSKKLIIGIAILFCAVIFVIGGTYAYLTSSDSKDIDNVATSNITLDYKDNTNYMRNNLIPVVESDVTKFASKNTLNNYTDEDICHYQDDMYACSLYEFTITNTADISQNIIVSMTPIINEYNNFYFILYESKANEINNDLSKIVNNTKIEQDTINFNNINIILKPKESKTYTIVFYIKNLDIPQDDANKRFTASILVNSITTGYKKVVQLGEGCYDFEELEDGTLKLTKFNGINHETGDIIEGCGVTKDEEGFYSVTVPSSYSGVAVSTLGNTLFSAANKLEDGTITGVNQFVNIEEVTISQAITIIEDGFADMQNMKGQGTFLGIGWDVVTQQPNPDRTLELSLPNNLKHIGDVAFAMTAVREIKIPASVEKIGFAAFNSNYNLTTLIFEENSSLTTIGDYAFELNNISSLTIPSSVQSIGKGAFSHNINLTTINFVGASDGSSLLTSIGEDAFSSSNLYYPNENNPLIIPSSVEYIGEGAFCGNHADGSMDNFKFVQYKGTNLEVINNNPNGSRWHGDGVTLLTE